MRAVLQRVSEAAVTVDGGVTGAIGPGPGLLILLGVELTDDDADLEWLVRKVARLRIFDDDEGFMNRSLIDVGGQALVVSQFTLHARTRKGTRPSFDRAAKREQAEPLYRRFCEALGGELDKPVRTGVFGAMMKVSLVNDGPVTVLLDSKNPEG